MRGNKRRLTVEPRRCCVCRCRGIRENAWHILGIFAGARRMRRLASLPGHSDGHRSYYGNYNVKRWTTPVAFPPPRPAALAGRPHRDGRKRPRGPRAVADAAWIPGGDGLSGTGKRPPRAVFPAVAGTPAGDSRRRRAATPASRRVAARCPRAGDPPFGVMTRRPHQSTFKTNEGRGRAFPAP